MGIVAQVVSTLASLVLVAGCSGAAAPNASSTPSAAASGTQSVVVWAEPWQVPALQSLADSYGPANAVVVEVQPVPADQMLARVIEAAPQGNGPDLFAGSNQWLGELADKHVVVPVDLAEVRVGFSAQSLQAFSLDGRDYAAPCQAENLALLRNIALAPKAPKSIEAMAAKGARLAKKGKVDVPIALPIGPAGDSYHWYPFYSAADGYIFGTNVDGSYNPANLGIGLPGSIQAGRKLAGLAEQGAIDPKLDLAGATTAFAAGRAAYLIGGPAEAAIARAAGVQLAVEPVPDFAEIPGSASQAMVSYSGFLMSAFATDRDAATQLLSRGIATTAFMDALFAARPRVPAWLPSAAKVKDDPRVAGFARSAAASAAMPSLAVMPATWHELGKAQAAILAGAAPKAAMASARAAVQETLARS